MAITRDQPLGSNSATAPTSIAITTSAAAAAGSRIVVVVSWFDGNARPSPTCSDGSAYTLDKKFTNGSDFAAVFSRVAAGGLASSSTITVTWTAGVSGTLVAACSYLGTTAVDTSGTNTGTTAAAWTTGSVACAVADSLYVAVAGTDGSMTSESSTPTNGTERFDLFLLAANQGMVMQDLIVSSIGSNALTGTWGTTTGLTTQTMATVVYSGTGAVGIPDLIMAPAHR